MTSAAPSDHPDAIGIGGWPASDFEVYRGPSIWASSPVIRMRASGADRLGARSVTDDDRRLLGELLPGSASHHCSVREGGPLAAAGGGVGVSWPHLAAHVALELQHRIGATTPIDATSRIEDVEAWDVTFEFEDADLGVHVGGIALGLADRSGAVDEVELRAWFAAASAGLGKLAESWGYRRGTQQLVAAARERGVPVIRLDASPRPLMQLGHGVHQRRIRSMTPDSTSGLGNAAALDKELTLSILAGIGMSVSESITVGDADAAVLAAGRIGYPVVVKPRWGSRGEDVFANLRSEQTVRDAFTSAHSEQRWDDVLVQRHERGREYRIAVMDDEVVAVLEKVIAMVIGDGERTVEELIALVNAEPGRGDAYDSVLSLVKLDGPIIDCLAGQGLRLDSVPEAGRQVRLADTSNTLMGASTVDRTDEIHPHNVVFARTAARAMGLDVVAVDLIADDIGVPFGESHAVIHEVNTGFGFAVHARPSQGTGRHLHERYLERLIPAGTDGRIPIIAVLGSPSSGAAVSRIAQALVRSGRVVGTATADGLAVDDVVVSQGDARGPDGALTVLRHPLAEVAVLEVSPAGALSSGLGFDRADIAILAGSAHDDAMGQVRRLLARSVAATGTLILDADDPDRAELEDLCPGTTLVVTGDAATPDGLAGFFVSAGRAPADFR